MAREGNDLALKYCYRKGGCRENNQLFTANLHGDGQAASGFSVDYAGA